MTKKNKFIKNKKAGFSMIELLVVATIIAVLSAIGLVSYQKANQSSRNAKRKADLETVRQALVLYKADKGTYYVSSSYTNLAGPSGELVSEGYLSSPPPAETKTDHDPYTYISDGSTFTLTATLEPDTEGTWEVDNP